MAKERTRKQSTLPTATAILRRRLLVIAAATWIIPAGSYEYDADASIDQFEQTLQTMEDASQAATNPAVTSTLDRIYGILEATKEQLVHTVLKAQ